MAMPLPLGRILRRDRTGQQLDDEIRSFVDNVVRDVRYAFRHFSRQRTFTAVIVGTLAPPAAGRQARRARAF